MIFCNPDFIDSRKLYRLLAGVLDLDASAFGRVYEDLQSSFDFGHTRLTEILSEGIVEGAEELSWDQRLLRNSTRKMELKPEYQLSVSRALVETTHSN
jgi:hypothetical protein